MIRELEDKPHTLRAVNGSSGMLTLGILLSLGLLLAPQPALGAGDVQSQTKDAVSVSRGDSAAGKSIYNRYCHYCHGRQGYGDGPVGTAITPHPADFIHDSKRMIKSDEKLFKSISEGLQRKIGGEAMFMPRWADILSEEEIWDVLSYIRELENSGRTREGLAPNVPKVDSDPVKSK